MKRDRHSDDGKLLRCTGQNFASKGNSESIRVSTFESDTQATFRPSIISLFSLSPPRSVAPSRVKMHAL